MRTTGELLSTAHLAPWAITTMPLILRAATPRNALPRWRQAADLHGTSPLLVAMLHIRKCGANFARRIRDGALIEKGADWVDDARLTLRNSGAPRKLGMSVEEMLDFCDLWAGEAYRVRQILSPFVWAATTHQQRGVFYRDGSFDPTTFDHQPGCAAMILGGLAALIGENPPLFRHRTGDRSMPTETPATVGPESQDHSAVTDFLKRELDNLSGFLPAPYRAIANVASGLLTIAGSVARNPSTAGGPGKIDAQSFFEELAKLF